MGSKKQRP